MPDDTDFFLLTGHALCCRGAEEGFLSGWSHGFYSHFMVSSLGSDQEADHFYSSDHKQSENETMSCFHYLYFRHLDTDQDIDQGKNLNHTDRDQNLLGSGPVKDLIQDLDQDQKSYSDLDQDLDIDLDRFNLFMIFMFFHFFHEILI